MSRLPRLMGFGAVVSAAAFLVPDVVLAADPIEDVPFAVAAGTLFDDPRNDGRRGEQGTWQVESGRLADDIIVLQVSIRPPTPGLPIASGPAVLFGGLRLSGDSGVGVELPFGGLSSLALPPCDEVDCRYDVTFRLPADDLARGIDQLEAEASLLWVSADFTLVRTFGDGTWLQVLPFLSNDSPVGSVTGTLRAIEPIDGWLFPFGLFPASEATPLEGDGLVPDALDYAAVVEAARRSMSDESQALAHVPAQLRVSFDPVCEFASGFAMHTMTGDWVFQAEAFRERLIDETLHVPTGTEWFLTLHDAGGIDFDQRSGIGIRVGGFVVGEEPLLVDASLDCQAWTGTVDVTGGVMVPEPAATPNPDEPALPAPSSPPTLLPPAVERPGASPPVGTTPVGIVLLLLVVLLVALLTRGSSRSKRL